MKIAHTVVAIGNKCDDCAAVVVTPESQHPLLCNMGVVATLLWLSISIWYLFSHGVYFHTHVELAGLHVMKKQ